MLDKVALYKLAYSKYLKKFAAFAQQDTGAVAGAHGLVGGDPWGYQVSWGNANNGDAFTRTNAGDMNVLASIGQSDKYGRVYYVDQNGNKRYTGVKQWDPQFRSAQAAIYSAARTKNENQYGQSVQRNFNNTQQYGQQQPMQQPQTFANKMNQQYGQGNWRVIQPTFQEKHPVLSKFMNMFRGAAGRTMPGRGRIPMMRFR